MFPTLSFTGCGIAHDLGHEGEITLIMARNQDFGLAAAETRHLLRRLVQNTEKVSAILIF